MESESTARELRSGDTSDELRSGFVPAPRTRSGPRTGDTSPILGRVNAAFFSLMDWYMHWKYAAMKSSLFAQIPDIVVEVGAGAGANFRYFAPGTKVIAVEPSVHMHAPLRRTAQRYGITLDVHTSGAEDLDLPSESVDAVVASLVLCTVADPERAIAEVRRVLRPGGKFYCIEHVAAPETTLIGKIQRLVFRPWRWFFEGCHTHRDTETALREAGFAHLELERVTLPSIFLPVRPHVIATCVK